MELIGRLLESKAGVLILAALLIVAQVAAVGAFAVAWHSYPLAPIAFTTDGWETWIGVSVLVLGTDALFVLLCDHVLMQRRQAMIDASVRTALAPVETERVGIQTERLTTAKTILFHDIHADFIIAVRQRLGAPTGSTLQTDLDLLLKDHDLRIAAAKV